MTGVVWGHWHFLPMVPWVQCQVMTRAVALLLPFFQYLCHSVFFFDCWENSYAERGDCGFWPGSAIGRYYRRRREQLVAPLPTEKDGTEAVERYRPGPAWRAWVRQAARANGTRITPGLIDDAPGLGNIN